MSKVFFRQELEGVATFWRILRRDGCTLGFTSHDRDLRFGGVLHRAAPGMVPSAIRRSGDIANDSAEVEGVLAHDAIHAADLAAGRYDGARFAVGVVDWETLEHAVLYHGEAGSIAEEDNGFRAELQSAKAALQADLVPRTSPTCRASFCGRECGLNTNRHTHELQCAFVDAEIGLVRFSSAPSAESLRDGWVRWIDGPHAGLTMQIMRSDGDGQLLDRALSPNLVPGARALLREGCDHTLATCHSRFGNAANFRGEPFLPGNDLLARYPTSSQ
ncbi:DUF2163 domain-containing protein [Alteraurantiacibacter aquimixticola]|uniref:DUF2163 domain-containing protein n=1 Tax=Alteraurantiacibacter aquimixticola TaxID=2489173 RepID=A0A4T3EXR7_9SPHN|nr:DUF2163 domain-containing protein [Alteraurantiacibacter aquimixticola]TIX49376.1 DUF2163 domain-containing protein [Alteraurantiacibacter aquimixticola]